ncbi:hypothetical protein [Arachidicoccus terrestris]|uniref:hypothetical protein n=1 Tax=Arachidicoccus terrestris TaxID=2875539 RepID=UPI001CC4D882|nr:hypothetical protein [Arachidicoccus terrestris]UAY56234.1 hypothetical protein K9M52_04240 [Arachidicoccus terrestris]
MKFHTKTIACGLLLIHLIAIVFFVYQAFTTEYGIVLPSFMYKVTFYPMVFDINLGIIWVILNAIIRSLEKEAPSRWKDWASKHNKS